jgi:hypothetical protein
VTGLPVIGGQQVAAPEKKQFEFWVGSWRVRTEVGEAVDGTN